MGSLGSKTALITAPAGARARATPRHQGAAAGATGFNAEHGWESPNGPLTCQENASPFIIKCVNADRNLPLAGAAGGDLYALWADSVTGHNPSLVTPTNSDDRYKQATRLKLYHSIDHGQTWTMQDVTPPNSGIIRYSWMGIADDGKMIGVGYFTHPTTTGTWHVFAGASSRFGYPVTYALVDPVEVAPAGDFAFGDFFEVAFDRAGRLNVVYTRCVDLVAGDTQRTA